jgi:hypothetical protein
MTQFTEIEITTRAVVEVPQLLRKWTRLHVEAASEVRRGGRIFDLAGAIGDIPFVAEVQSDGGVNAVRKGAEQLRQSGDAVPILVVPYMSASGRRRCEDAGLSWMDLSGNAGLHLLHKKTHVVVTVEGQPDKFRGPGRPRNAFAPKAARVVRLLLADPERRLTQAEIAEASHLGAGYVSRIVRYLEDEGLLSRDADRALWPHDPDLLLSVWAESDAFRHEVLMGHVLGRSGEERAERLQKALAAHGVRFAFTGLAAAWAYTHAAAFRSVSCYVQGEGRASALADAGFRADTDAPNTRILVPADDGVFDGSAHVSGLVCVSAAQAVVDLEHESERAPEFREAMRERALPWSGAALSEDARDEKGVG